jgi:nucleoid DNA-binding protein
MRSIYIGEEGKVTITSKEAYNHYKSTAVFRKKENTYTLRQYSKIVRAFYSKVADNLVENEGGVFLKNFGYFTVIAHPKRQVVKVPYGDVEYFNFNTDNHLYLPTFFNISRGKPLLNLWVMDRTFSRSKVRARLHKALVSGKKFKTYVATLASLYLLKE